MKGDFSRNTFNPQKKYRAVRMQQGRVLLDADWNEMVDIVNDQHTTGLRNIVGAHGGLDDGFMITLVEPPVKWRKENAPSTDMPLPGLHIRAGQYYVDGYSCTLTEDILFEEQADFPGAATHKSDILADHDSENWVLYLDVWERHLTAIEDPDLSESSLGGADTTTRTKVVWQVKMLPLKGKYLMADREKTEELEKLPEWMDLVRTRNHLICINPGIAIENELFRIEIHAGNDDGNGKKEVTWKWSRDNASIAFPLHDIQPVANQYEEQQLSSFQITVDDNQHLHEPLSQGNYVELECDDWVLNGRPGWLGKITQVESPDKDGRQRLLVTALESVGNIVDPALLQRRAQDREKIRDQHPLLRRWDHIATSRLPTPSLDLEHGIKVEFTEDKYRTGDHWIIPIRSGVTPNRELKIPQAITVHSWAPLALLARQGAQWEIKDLRRKFLNLRDVSDELKTLREELDKTKESLKDLYDLTKKEYQQQEDEISALQKEVADLKMTVGQLPVLTIQQSVKRYRSDEVLDIGEVVARALSQEDCITRASREMAPIGVIAPRPGHFDQPDEYSVVLSGPVMCRIHGQVKAGDLLVAAGHPGALEKASLWERWFESDRIVARAIDNPTEPEDQMINVYFMPSLIQ